MKVWPKSDEIRKVLTHPQGNIGFREQGPADWPDDSYTHRRIMDGDITVEDQTKVVNEETRAAPASKKSS